MAGAALLSLMMFLAPALGATSESLVQDTLKSAIVAFSALVAALLFFWSRRDRVEPVRWHLALALPLALMAYALGSMAWSHAYLAGVEAIRWFLFALIMFLALNTTTRERLPWLAWGIAAGATVASLWAALQFWFGLDLFPQGPHPASTFVNRNFFAEYAACTIAFVAMLLAQERKTWRVALLSSMAGLVLLAICMTGTRAALVAVWLQLLVLFPVAAWRWRSGLALKDWPMSARLLSGAILAGMLFGLGLLPTGDKELIAEGHGTTPLARAFLRTASIAPGDASLQIRKVMWRATGRMIESRPLSGVGAGAWENDIPLYQDVGSQLETDFYVHNEFLQLVAEYGVSGWVFLAGLAAWLLRAAAQTWREADPQTAAWRGALLASLLALFVVSNVGFPWRMASTGSLFALSLGGIAAFDGRREWKWQPSWSLAASAAIVAAIGLAAHITSLAVQAEADLVRATRIAIGIGESGNPNDPRLAGAKAEMLRSLREGIAITPHYRKLTPIAADEMARWGDWVDAIWVWQSVLSSRPNIVAILANVARGYMATGHPDKAVEYIERAKRIQPEARAVRSAEVLLLARTGREAQALEIGKRAILQGVVDYDMSNAVFALGRRLGDPQAAEAAMKLRLANWERDRVKGWLQLAELYDTQMHDPAKAVQACNEALRSASPADRAALRMQIPAAIRDRLDPSLPPNQTSASKG